MEQALAAILQGNVGRLPVSLLVAPYRRTGALLCRFPSRLRPIIEGQLAAHYPNITAKRADEGDLNAPPDWRTWSIDLRLRPDIFPIRRYSQFEDPLNRNTTDPLTSILAAVSAARTDTIRPMIDITLRPARAGHVKHARKVLRHLASPFLRSHPRIAHFYAVAATGPAGPLRLLSRLLGSVFYLREEPVPAPQLATSPSRTHDREEDLVAASDKLGRHLFEASIRLTVCGPPDQGERASSSLLHLAGAFAQFTTPRTSAFCASRIRVSA